MADGDGGGRTAFVDAADALRDCGIDSVVSGGASKARPLGLDAGWTTEGSADEAATGIAAGDEAWGSCAGEVGDEEAGVE